MDERLLKLLALASEPILTSPHTIELEALHNLNITPTDLTEALSWKNGWYAFESSLHVFPLGKKDGVFDLQSWNSEALWRTSYGDLARNAFFFAEDVFGGQFCFKQDKIHLFEPETGETQFFANELGEWAGKIVDNYCLYTGFPLAHEWQKQHGALRPGKRLLPKTPFVLQGAYTVENLYAADCVEGMRFRGDIALQLRGLPDGSKVRLKVTP